MLAGWEKKRLRVPGGPEKKANYYILHWKSAGTIAPKRWAQGPTGQRKKPRAVPGEETQKGA